MGKPDVPEPPDPRETSAASTGTNVGTAIANAMMGNVNQYTPDGSLEFSQNGTYQWNDPYTGQTYDIPQFSATQSLSDNQQGIKDQNDRASLNLSTLAADQSGRINEVLGEPFDLSKAPSAGRVPTYSSSQMYSSASPLAMSFGDAGQIQRSVANAGQIQRSVGDGGRIQSSVGDGGRIQSSIGDGGAIQRGIGTGGEITRTYGTDFSEDRQRVEDALMARMQPYLDRDKDALQTQLSNQGIKAGSQAFSSSQDDFGRSVNDARFGAILNAGQEQSRLVGMERDRAGFENAAQGQAFGQGLARGQFANAAQNQAFGQGATRGAFANAAQNQRFGQGLARGQFANSAQNQRFGQGLARGQFANAAQAQQYGQNLSDGQFANAAQAQNYGQLLGRATFGNAARQGNADNTFRREAGNNQSIQQNNAMRSSAFAQQNALRSQYLQEQFATRNQPINEIAALMSGSQVSQPNFINANMPTIPTTDTAGIINNHYDQQVAQAQAGNQNILGGLFGMGASLLSNPALFAASDERVKRNIKKVGNLDGLPLYRYRYKGQLDDGKEHVGVIAQEAEKKRPDAVEKIDGVRHVNYGALFGMGKAA